MGLKRFLFLVVLAATAAAFVLVPGAAAGNYDEQAMGCSGENPATCPTGTEGVPYTLPLKVLEEEGCEVHQVTSGTLPPGLSVNSHADRIEGTRTKAVEYRFFLTVSLTTCPYPCGSKCSSDDDFIIKINPGLAKLTIGPESTTPSTRGVPYSLQMTATVPDPKTWSINSGALPPGVALDANSGLISGTPTAAGQFDFQVLAKMNGDSRTDTKSLAIVVRDPVAIAGSDPFTAQRRALTEVTAPFQAMLTASGGTGTYTWALTSGELPPGMTMADGAIAGNATTEGVYPFTASATDSEGRIGNYAGRVVVSEKLAVSTLLLKRGKVGKFYSARLRTTGGVRPTSWRILVGPLPRGIRFDRSIGQLFGTPKRPGRYRMMFEATDELGIKARKALTIVVTAPPKPKKISG